MTELSRNFEGYQSKSPKLLKQRQPVFVSPMLQKVSIVTSNIKKYKKNMRTKTKGR